MIGPERREGRQRRADPLADLGMAPHDRPLVVIERPGLRQDPIRDADLPDVVEQRAVGDCVQLLGRDVAAQRDPGREMGEPLAVVLGRRVLGLHGVRQRGHDRVGGFHPHERAAKAQCAADPG